MIEFNIVKENFILNGGVLKTSELKKLGLSSRQIKKLMKKDKIEKIKYGFYTIKNYFPKEEVLISRFFPEAVIFLESALRFYNYIDRIPRACQIAVENHSNPNKYELSYFEVKPFYIIEKYQKLGIKTYEIDNVKVKIYDRDKSICDLVRYEDKVDPEIFSTALRRYIDDEQKNINSLIKYAQILNIREKIDKYIGVWV
ncbi:type IV toxin-antitoxin system AbiEi family antitoxin domain-containing protein [Halanaerobium kushneri]|uniref:Transcriptional regulator, AbiEi antitoxin, Type IV TA system n=1 Tax=Halanaerobium kushneri TaxID=56779 RepID=A0A1N6ZHD2_9FIRM|nr:type IV toxin-antitoxin system AbiEi family antitoxin domain-containing protein [Halanaerobium kushneri]SIR26223.1 Transcriptional regulator, AbiEi antitoxin, Type IV TA system [Halanaerobium kushneri]